ncbi:MAG TPA: class I SAM-dependent methyltransferase [Acidimicrobiales bacterium]|jgi:SAM-dependent methyltransferase
MTRERRTVFGEAVEQYENARPGYPEALVDDILSYADPASEILEVGAGTGKATVSFARREVAITCLEPDARMAARLKALCAPYPRVTVEVGRLEEYSRPLAFDALIAAQSWHWVDPAHRWDLAYDALREGGTVALFWNKYIVADESTRTELAQLDKKFEIVYGANGMSREENEGEIVIEEGWPAYDLLSDSRFEDFVSRRYRRELGYDEETYMDLLASTSAYRVMDDSARAELFGEARAILARRHEPLVLNVVTDLFLGRTTGTSTSNGE